MKRIAQLDNQPTKGGIQPPFLLSAVTFADLRYGALKDLSGLNMLKVT